MPAVIESVGNAADRRLADYLDLVDPAARRARERDELFVAEGLSAVRRLLESGHRVRSILVTPRRLSLVQPLIGEGDVVVYVADESVLATTVGFDLHRGIVAAADRRPLPSVDDVVAGSRLVAVLEGLNDPENLGAVARSARAFGVDALLLDPTCIDPYYRRTVRVSMGEVLMLDVARFEDWPDGLDALHRSGFQTWALTPEATGDDLWSLDMPERLALVLGAEGPGLTTSTLQRASRRVRIPIGAGVDSLNVGHAAAVAFAVCGRRR